MPRIKVVSGLAIAPVVALALAVAVTMTASPASAQVSLEPIFEPPKIPKPKKKPPPAATPAVKQPEPVPNPEAVAQPAPSIEPRPGTVTDPTRAKPPADRAAAPAATAPAAASKTAPAALPPPAAPVATVPAVPAPVKKPPAAAAPAMPPAATRPAETTAAREAAPAPGGVAPAAAPAGQQPARTSVHTIVPPSLLPEAAAPTATIAPSAAPAAVKPNVGKPSSTAPPPAVAPAPAPAAAVAAVPPADAASPPPSGAPAANPGEPAPAKPAATHTAAIDYSHMMPPKPKPANCKNSGDFAGWLAGFRKMAAAEGVSRATISGVLDGMTLDQGIINRDRGGQKVFTQSFLDFSSKLANPSRLKSSISKLNKHKAIFDRAEAEFGVPGPVITAFWALESDFGAGMGNLPILRSLATLAYDCRRGEMFTGELLAALKLIDRGDMRPEEMVGSWAGEIGQTQFLPAHVLNYAIDYDGDGRSDLFRNNADIIGTSANFVKQLGWRAGEPWLQEVRLTKNLPWEQADLAVKHPIATWSAWGVIQLSGAPLADGPPASLVLPMGRRGPAFLAYPNFDVYTRWNQSLVYALTAAHLATRVAGAPAMSRGDPNIPMLTAAEVKELQQLMARKGLYEGEFDGKMGAGTRAAVKQAQIKLRMPADSYPTPELLESLRGGG